MNEKLANVLKTNIEGLNFIDKIAGLVKPMTITKVENGAKVKKTFPVACDVTADQCVKGNYQELIPNSKYKSIAYFEDLGSAIEYKDRNRVKFTSRLNLVCWLNLKKLAECGLCVISPQVILMLMANLPEFPVNDDIYRDIRITAVSETPKSNTIFSRYTYDELISQYLLSPYDYFCLQITVQFWVNLDCVNDLILTECTC